ncbi:tRNA (adenosine(37)-N6)-threonylcarbamoyltransferase complex dimerization subunit type 1 TsaB [Undibacterium sp. SXout7W]|uniref:tRNA (adenosine(37)-N6)-threonylcarbamoyltransferase complex dimerization subunit type 1 TsaB n=1 Tax=Undibacterium sp. SXout7W TaxID=3413049 RepID=UPI003BF0B75F
MTTILAIETSTELATAVLLVGEHIFSRELSGVQTHSQAILPAIQSLLVEAGVRLSDCDAIAFGCGPGAFTGIRTACGIVQGLAFGADLPVLPVVSLQAMAAGAKALRPGTDFVCILDARMAEVYWAHYHFDGAACQQVTAPALSTLAQLSEQDFSAETLFVLGQGVALPETLQAFPVILCAPHARDIAHLARVAFQQGLALPAEMAQPLYLRNKIALTTAERLLAKEALQGQGV